MIEMHFIETLEQILSTLRHELGNSTNSMKITLNVLRDNYDLFDDVKKKDYLKRMSVFVDRQQRLVEAMRSYKGSNLEEGEEISFPLFWKNLFVMTSNRLKNENVRLIHRLETGPCLIKANNMGLNKVMRNILDNAIEAVEDINNPIVESTAMKKDGFILIQIKDNGCGIKDKDKSKIFIPLFSTKSGKMGMGLPIAHKFLLKMKGKIEIDSVVGTGTEARIWIRAVDDQKRTSKQSK